MRFHVQNLNEKAPHVPGQEPKTGWIIRHGRCWLKLLWTKWHCGWTFFRPGSVGFELSLSDYDEDAVGGNIQLGWLFGFYWGMNTPGLKRFTDRITSRDLKPREIDQCSVCLRPKDGHQLGADWTHGHHFTPRTYWSTNGRTMGIRFFEGTLWIDLWNDPMESRSSDPKWWHISIDLKDLVFGKPVYKQNPIETRQVFVPMPEGGYRGTATLSEDTWGRRWSTKRVLRVHIDMNDGQGIPFPGKGENAWDCGEDACHGLTTPAETILEGVLKMTRSVMNDRIRYGGWDWKPEKVKS